MIPKPLLKKETVSIDVYKRRRKQNNGHIIFDGMFDPDFLNFEGNVLPKSVKPPLLKSAADLEDMSVRQRRH